jgi:hypothetical protein
MASGEISFSACIDKHKGKDFLIYCPGKNIVEWHDRVMNFVKEKDLITIGCNKVFNLFKPTYHIFTNSEKYREYGGSVNKSSTPILGLRIVQNLIDMYEHKTYICVKHNDKDPNEKIEYDKKRDIIRGYYRTSGNLAIMVASLMGSRKIYIAGMSGFLFNFDGTVHYYNAEVPRDVKSKEEWHKKYDVPISRALGNLKKAGIDFEIITPTIYSDHFNPGALVNR